MPEGCPSADCPGRLLLEGELCHSTTCLIYARDGVLLFRRCVVPLLTRLLGHWVRSVPFFLLRLDLLFPLLQPFAMPRANAKAGALKRGTPPGPIPDGALRPVTRRRGGSEAVRVPVALAGGSAHAPAAVRPSLSQPVSGVMNIPVGAPATTPVAAPGGLAPVRGAARGSSGLPSAQGAATSALPPLPLSSQPPRVNNDATGLPSTGPAALHVRVDDGGRSTGVAAEVPVTSARGVPNAVFSALAGVERRLDVLVDSLVVAKADLSRATSTSQMTLDKVERLALVTDALVRTSRDEMASMRRDFATFLRNSSTQPGRDVAEPVEAPREAEPPIASWGFELNVRGD